MSNKNIELIDKRNKIYVKTGLEMSLTAEDNSFCEKCTYVGQKRDQYIVVTPPPDFAALENKLRQADPITVRYSFEGDIFEFSSKLMEIKYKPLMLLMLQFPDSIEKKELRSQKRICCFLSATMEINNETQDGIIKDISKFGCRFVLETSGKLEKPLRSDDQIALAFDFPGISDRQEIMGTIKDIRKKESRLDVGIKFAKVAWWVPPYD
jgi:c-di-GMP-binding flagellar brake protein YcgR